MATATAFSAIGSEPHKPWFPVSAGLLTWDHFQRLGTAWMVFLWMIHQQRQPKNGEADTGAVHNGQPISYPEIGAALGGMPLRTVERHVTTLEREGYVRSKQIGGKGKSYWIANPIRWTMTRNGAEQPAKSGELFGNPPEVADSNPPEVAGHPRHKCGEAHHKSGGDNKEARTKNNPITKPSSEPSSDGENQARPVQGKRPPSTDGMTLANELLAEILTNKPDFHVTDDRLASWARSADLMIANDHRSPPRVSALIRWVQHDSFWKVNVLSMDKLREKFDQLEMKMQQTAKGGNFNGKQLSSDEYLKQALAAAARMRGTVQ